MYSKIIPDSIIANILSYLSYNYLRYIIQLIPNLTKYKIDIYDQIACIIDNQSYKYINNNIDYDIVSTVNLSNLYYKYHLINYIKSNNYNKFNLKYIFINISSNNYSFFINNLIYIKNATKISLQINKQYTIPHIINSICNLKYLSYLSISANNISNDHINQLINLNTLKITSYSNITNEAFKNLTKLKYLYIVNCTNISDNGIKHLTNLEYFAGNYFSFTPECFCNNLLKLQQLLLSYILNYKRIHITNSNNLVAYTQYQHLTPTQLKYFKSLYCFTINYTKIIYFSYYWI
jgi:hypothetical protein